MSDVPFSMVLTSTLIMIIAGGFICFVAGSWTRTIAPVMAAFALHVGAGLGRRRQNISRAELGRSACADWIKGHHNGGESAR